jgi:hypothetical protein
MLQHPQTVEAGTMGGQKGGLLGPTDTRGYGAVNLKDYWPAPTLELIEGLRTKCRLPSPW